MSLILILFIILQFLIGFYLIFPMLLLGIGSLRNKQQLQHLDGPFEEVDYAFIVTAYEQTVLIPSVVASILKSNYSNYIIYIVADNCDISELVFSDPKVQVLRPATVLASNTKSHFYAIQHFKRNHERLTIIDSDNLVHPEYLNELNQVFNHGYVAIQGVRQAKNLNSQYACLDEAGDIYYRFIDRKLLYDAGSSASLAGSGMAFTTQIYRECLEHLEISGAGFDKILQYELLERKLTIAFAEKAIVFDEKTAKTDQLVKQRARWINTWFKFFILGLKMKLNAIANLNWNQLLFSLMLLRPPLFILLLLSGIFSVIDLFVMPELLLGWVLAFIMFIFVFYKALSHFKANENIYRSLRNAPKFIYFQMIALVKANKANELSVATKHEHPANPTQP